MDLKTCCAGLFAFLGSHSAQGFDLPEVTRTPDGGAFIVVASGEYLESVLAAGDLDGDGADDLVLHVQDTRFCGSEPRRGQLLTWSSTTGIESLRVGGAFLVDRTLDGRAFLIHGAVDRGANTSWLELRSSLSGEVLRDISLSSNSTYESVAFIGDVDGDGVEDVAVGDAWFPPDPTWPDDAPPAGSLEVRSGRDGHSLWRVRGTIRSPDEYRMLGVSVQRAGFFDGDDIPDVAVAVLDYASETTFSIIEVRSGADGALLGSMSLPEGMYPSWKPLADLDGDGLAEILLTVEREESRPTSTVEVWSLRAGPFVGPVGEQELLFATGVSDVDGDGLDDLLVGIQEPERGDRIVSVATARGLTELWVVPDDEPAWEGGISATSGDFDGDGLLDLALVLEDEGAFWGTIPRRVRVYPAIRER